ncbi:2'-5' RNA ligase family protein [Gaiella sp.]|uniref:2'-5' RNA ligase family protein n=1 Tax=Gaiella sp. TaxID=2663207 RepID=UPI00398361F2
MPGLAPHERRSGLLIPVDADSLVGDFRNRYNAATVARGLPPHVTILFPFARGANVSETYDAVLTAHFATFGPFEAELTGVGQFDRFVWLAPEPRERFVDLIGATCSRFPEFPPYEGQGGEPEPHLTIAAVDASAATEPITGIARCELQPLLPFRFTVDSVSLFEEREDATWRATTRYGLG